MNHLELKDSSWRRPDAAALARHNAGQRKIDYTIDDELRRAAANRFGATDVRVVRSTNRSLGNQSAEVWLLLSVLVGDGWTIVGRRQTRAELLAMIQERTPESAAGIRFNEAKVTVDKGI